MNNTENLVYEVIYDPHPYRRALIRYVKANSSLEAKEILWKKLREEGLIKVKYEC